MGELIKLRINTTDADQAQEVKDYSLWLLKEVGYAFNDEDIEISGPRSGVYKWKDSWDRDLTLKVDHNEMAVSFSINPDIVAEVTKRISERLQNKMNANRYNRWWQTSSIIGTRKDEGFPPFRPLKDDMARSHNQSPEQPKLVYIKTPQRGQAPADDDEANIVFAADLVEENIISAANVAPDHIIIKASNGQLAEIYKRCVEEAGIEPSAITCTDVVLTNADYGDWMKSGQMPDLPAA